MADTPDVEVAEITPDDFDKDEIQDSPKAEPSPAKPEEEAPAESEDKKPEAEADEVEADETEGEVADETKPQGKAEERKATLNTEIRDLVSERNALRSEVEKINSQVYAPATADELVEQGYSATDANVEALRQEIAMRDYNEKVADAQLTLSSESQRILTDFPAFNPDNESYDKELAAEAAELLEANLIKDENSGQIIGSTVSPYKLYKTIARASGISATKGQIQGQQDTEKMLANADSGNSAAPKTKETDPLTQLWDEEL